MSVSHNHKIIDEQLHFIDTLGLLDTVKCRILTYYPSTIHPTADCSTVVNFFYWAETTEGHRYWLEIQNQLLEHVEPIPGATLQDVFTYIFPSNIYPELHL